MVLDRLVIVPKRVSFASMDLFFFLLDSTLDRVRGSFGGLSVAAAGLSIGPIMSKAFLSRERACLPYQRVF